MDMRFFVRDDQSEIPESSGRFGTYNPYRQPPNSPTYHADAPSLYEANQMIANPYFAVEPAVDWDILDRVDKCIKESRSGTRQDMRRIVEEIDYYMPEFSQTQLTPDELDRLDRSPTTDILQIGYAIYRLLNGAIDEGKMHDVSEAFDRHSSKAILHYIENEHVRNRILQTRELWRHTLQSPWRNYFYRLPMEHIDDYDTFRANQIDAAKKMEQHNIDYFSFTTEEETSDHRRLSSGGLDPMARTIVITESESDVHSGLVLEHELIHCLQLNERIKRTGSEASWQTTEKSAALKRGQPIWDASKEVEAHWVDAHLCAAQLKALRQNVDTFADRMNFTAAQHTNMKIICSLLERSPKSTTQEIPTQFSKNLIASTKYSRNCRVVTSDDRGNLVDL